MLMNATSMLILPSLTHDSVRSGAERHDAFRFRRSLHMALLMASPEAVLGQGAAVSGAAGS